MPLITSTTFPMFTDSQFRNMAKNVDILVGEHDEANDGSNIWQEHTRPLEEPKPPIYQLYGLGPMSYMGETEDPGAQRPDWGHSIRRGMRRYGTSVVVTKDFALMDKTVVDQIPAMLKDSHVQTLMVARENFYDEAIQGATVTTINGRKLHDPRAIDGLAYFHEAHTFKNRPNITNSNLSEVDLASFSWQAIETMVNQALSWRGPDGLPMNVPVAGIVVASNILGRAHQLVKSDKETGTANNDLNIMKVLADGSAISNIETWRQMPDDEFMLKLKVPQMGKMRGLTTAFWNENAKTNNYYKTNSQRVRVFEITTCFDIYGDDWREYITSRPKVA